MSKLNSLIAVIESEARRSGIITRSRCIKLAFDIYKIKDVTDINGGPYVLTDTALKRLINMGIIERLSRGLYKLKN